MLEGRNWDVAGIASLEDLLIRCREQIRQPRKPRSVLPAPFPGGSEEGCEAMAAGRFPLHPPVPLRL
jgi:hypothetical protein